MPAKRRSSKFIQQAPNPNAPEIVDVDAELSLLSGNAEKLGADLIKISKSGNFQKISKLLAHLDAPQFVNQTDKLGWNALMCACKEGHSDTVSLLLSAGAALESVDNNGYTSLMWASYKGREDVVSVLLSAGASINRRNNGGWNAFMLAAMNGRLGVLRQLSEAGADPLAKNDSNRSVLDIADEECKEFIEGLFAVALEEENKRLAELAEEEERQRMEQEEAEQLARELAVAAELERQRQLAEQEEQERVRAELAAKRQAEEAEIAAAKARKKAEAEQKALERARVAAEKAAAKEQKKLEMGEDYVSEEEEPIETVTTMKPEEPTIANMDEVSLDQGGVGTTSAEPEAEISSPPDNENIAVHNETSMELVVSGEDPNDINQSLVEASTVGETPLNVALEQNESVS